MHTRLAERSAQLAPGFVIAMPQLTDPNFRQSVVLLIKSSEEGALGVIINRPSDLTIRELCDNHGLDYEGPDEQPLMIGGPVEMQTHLLVLHGEEPILGDLADKETRVAPGVRLISATEGLAKLASLGSVRVRCFAGYAGWGPGQIQSEIEEGAWLPLPADASLLFAQDSSEIWSRAIRSAGIDPAALVPGTEVN